MECPEITLPNAEPALERVFAAINAIDPALDFFEIHVFTEERLEGFSEDPASRLPLPGIGRVSGKIFPNDSATGLSVLLTKAREVPDAQIPYFGVIVIFRPFPGLPEPFRQAPRSIQASVFVANGSTFLFQDRDVASYALAACLGPSGQAMQVVPLRRILPNLTAPRWTLDRPLYGFPSLPETSIADCECLAQIRTTGVALDGSFVNEKTLRDWQGRVFNGFLSWTRGGNVFESLFDLWAGIYHAEKQDVVGRYPTIRHWMNDALTIGFGRKTVPIGYPQRPRRDLGTRGKACFEVPTAPQDDPSHPRRNFVSFYMRLRVQILKSLRGNLPPLSGAAVAMSREWEVTRAILASAGDFECDFVADFGKSFRPLEFKPVEGTRKELGHPLPGNSH